MEQNKLCSHSSPKAQTVYLHSTDFHRRHAWNQATVNYNDCMFGIK